VRVCSDRGPDGEADDIASRSACRGLGTSRAAIETLCGNEERRRPGEFGTCPRQICATLSTKSNCKVVMTRYPIGSELRRFHVPRPRSRDNCGVVEPRLNQSELEHCTSPLHHLTRPSHNHCKRIGHLAVPHVILCHLLRRIGRHDNVPAGSAMWSSRTRNGWHINLDWLLNSNDLWVCSLR
jgi:hypothetical protein